MDKVYFLMNEEKQNLIDKFVIQMYNKYKNNSVFHELPKVKGTGEEAVDLQNEIVIDDVLGKDIETFFSKNYNVICPGLDESKDEDFKVLTQYYNKVVDNLMKVIGPYLSNYETTIQTNVPIKKEKFSLLHPFKKAATAQMEITISKVLNKNGKYDLHYTSTNSKFLGKDVVLDEKGNIISKVGNDESYKQLESIAKKLYSEGKNVDYLHDEFIEKQDTSCVKGLVMRVIDGAEKVISSLQFKVDKYNRTLQANNQRKFGRSNDNGKV